MLFQVLSFITFGDETCADEQANLPIMRSFHVLQAKNS